MAVSKRLRYEILRRDNHSCRYCGATAPGVKLTVDHVIPQVLGGSNEPSNLVTACSDCNNGKSATMPDAPTVDDIEARSAQWASAMRQAADELSADRRAVDDVCRAFDEVWSRYRPVGWRSTIEAVYAAGLPADVIVEMAHVAQEARDVDSRWNYFCGCCWKRVGQLQDRAARILDAPADARTHANQHARSNAPSICSEHMLDEDAIERVWNSANTEYRAKYGRDLAECLCFGDCESDYPNLCRAGIAFYMRGWMGHEEAYGTHSIGQENPSEVTDGAALDPA
ncbi:HNH endonuclease [Rhodococcus aetherivorans]|uniref:HNH endonuclease n=1 Tax=Rhodococcus aetherivorans TaxID=191292 RepID=UPI0002D22F92|nr:HNH endonuclease [Rhodococcus aetherivorans]CCW14628.1 hypothetical protein EBESD8_51980 [Rhodococcus aetherivorans]